MKRIFKEREMTSFSRFRVKHGNEDWSFFRNFDSGKLYSKLKTKKVIIQYNICAYCEQQLSSDLSQIRIEHILDKDRNHDEKNLTYSWDNLLAVCFGGMNSNNTSKNNLHLHCDSYKSFIKEKHPNTFDLQKLLNPFNIASKSRYFRVNRFDGSIEADPDFCANKIYNNISLSDAISYTINILNLNTEYLKNQRKELFVFYEKRREIARNKNKPDILNSLAASWFSHDNLKFFTTKRNVLGRRAEIFLNSQQKIRF